MILNNLMEEEDYKKIELLDSLLKNKPSDARILVLKGRILHSKMADDLAVETFKQAIQINPQCVAAYFWLAESLCFHLADWEQAEAIALQGLQIDPKRKDLVELLAIIRENLADWKLTVQKLKKNKEL